MNSANESGEYSASRIVSVIDNFSLLILSLILVATFVGYSVAIGGSFMGDDYNLLAIAAREGLSPAALFKPLYRHLQPVFKILLVIEWKLFGANPKPYYLVSLALHLLNTIGIFLVGSRIFNSRLAGLVSAGLFGVCSGFWLAPLWIAAQGNLLASGLMLAAVGAWLKHDETSNDLYLGAATILYALMIFTFPSGVLLPFILGALILSKTKKTGMRVDLNKVFISITPFLAVLLIYIIARAASQTPSVFSAHGGLGSSIKYLPAAFYNFFTGAFYGPIASFTGGVFFTSFNHVIAAAVVAAILIIIGIDRKKLIKGGGWAMLLTLALLFSSLYFQAAFYNAPYGIDVFMMTNSFLYLPTVAAALVAGGIFHWLKPFTGRSNPILGAATLALLVGIMFSNMNNVKTVYEANQPMVERYDIMVERYVKKFKNVTSADPDRRLFVIDSPFTGSFGLFSGGTALPSSVARVMVEPDQYNQVDFIHPSQANRADPQWPVFGIAEGNFRAFIRK